MDQDSMRRGRTATHVRLSERTDRRTGESLAICIGDCGLFLSYDVLSRLDVDPKTLRDVLSYYSINLTSLGLAQMQDLALAHAQEIPDERDIERVLIEKSGRYTFSLPLSIGAMIAGAHEHVPFLESFGERLGFIFQVKDDEIALFADPKLSGKPIGGDIREGKKTLHWHALTNALESHDRNALSVFGDREASEESIRSVLELFETYGIKETINTRLEEEARMLRSLVDEQDLSDGQRSDLKELIDWNLKRTA